MSRFEARPKNLKIASAQPVTEYVDIIPDILPNTTSGKLRFLAWLRMDFELIIEFSKISNQKSVENPCK